MSPISSIVAPIAAAVPSASPSSASSGVSFQSMLKSAVNNVEQSGAKADAAVADYLSGGSGELHSTILATQNADLNFEMFMQVRNKVVSAYEEIMRMQV